MRPEGFDVVVASHDPDRDSTTITQKYRRRESLPGLFVLTAMGFLVAAPQLALAATAVAMADVRASIANHPVVALQLALAMLLWIALIAWPVRRITRRLTRERHIEIAAGTVTVTDTFFNKTVIWRQPLAAYAGVAHVTRTSLGSRRDELVLVHPDAAHSLILAASDRISAADHHAEAQAVGLPLLAPGAAYRLAGGSWSAPPASAPVSTTPARAPAQAPAHETLAIARAQAVAA